MYQITEIMFSLIGALRYIGAEITFNKPFGDCVRLIAVKFKGKEYSILLQPMREKVVNGFPETPEKLLEKGGL